MSANPEPEVVTQSNEETQELIWLEATHPGEGEGTSSNNAGRAISNSGADEALGSIDTNEAAGSKNANEEVVLQQPDPPRRPTSFWHLPREIRQGILTLACHHDRLHHDHDPGLSTDCSRTINALSLTSRTLYADMMPLLYANVRLTRPSDLRIFAATLNARPSLGQLVKRIHLGPVDALNEEWWPVREHKDPCSPLERMHVAMIDRAFEEIDVPSWLTPTHGFYWWVNDEEEEEEDREKDGHASSVKAASQALEAAAGFIDIKLAKDWYRQGAKRVKRDRWYICTFEVQACLELYLLEMGRRDSKSRAAASHRKDAASPKPSYPRLVVQTADQPRQNLPGDEDVLWLSRAQVLTHIARRRAMTDHFDHPLLFARSGMPWAARDHEYEWHEGDVADVLEAGTVRPDFPRSEMLDVGDAGIFGAFDGLCDFLDPSLPSTATLGGIMALARSLFAVTPFVESVSLTGFLERLFCGVRPPPFVKSLRSLSIGPLPACWHTALHLSHPTFANLARLRLCGRELSGPDIREIVGGTCIFRQTLQKLQWSLSDRWRRRHGVSLLSTLMELCFVRNEETNSNAAVSEAARSGPSLSIELRVDWADERAVFATPHMTEAVREALRAGIGEGDSMTRLKVAVHQTDHDDVAWARVEEFEKERREWWESDLSEDGKDSGALPRWRG